MPDIHTIRLRHPWKQQVRDESVVWSRAFNWPAGLTPRERVALVIEGLPPEAHVSLNGQELPDDFDVTALIELNNRITIEIPGGKSDSEARFPYSVHLEIDEG